MKSIDTYFKDFLSDIRLTDAQRKDLITGHKTLTDRLKSDPDLKSIIINTFLQGSYKRSTAVRPLNDKRADADVIVVTNLDKSKLTPEQAIAKFIPFVEKYYKGKYRVQGRSIGIELSYVDLDIVITSAPSEVDTDVLRSASVNTSLSLEDFSSSYDWRLIKAWSEPVSGSMMSLSEALRKEPEWKLAPLWIPDRDAKEWVETHPLEQIRWTRDKNKNTNTHYINVVKALKWWRILKVTDIKHPKGYPVEHMIGDNCPDGITSVAAGVCLSLEAIVKNYALYRMAGTKPSLRDRGVPEHDVWKRVSVEEFKKFYDHVKAYAKIAREAMNAKTLKEQVEKWREIFGDKFPKYEEEESSKSANSSAGLNKGMGLTLGFSQREEVTKPTPERFA